MRLLQRLLREPLVHFLAVGAAIFAVFALLREPAGEGTDEITVSRQQVERFAALWQKTRRRPPTQAELDGLVADYIKEEIYYREALKLGLEKNDTIIRRRLRQKIEFLSATAADALTPTEAELKAFLETHRAKYRQDTELAFRQVFISPERRGAEAAAAARRLLGRLKRLGPDADLSQIGDATLLPSEVGLAPTSRITRRFGPNFAAGLAGLAAGEWSGPVKSAYGLHLVLVRARKPARDPELAEIRAKVLRDWRAENRRKTEAAHYERLKRAYRIRVDRLETPGGTAWLGK